MELSKHCHLSMWVSQINIILSFRAAQVTLGDFKESDCCALQTHLKPAVGKQIILETIQCLKNPVSEKF